jgi:nucleoside-diphosphate-sugar epimerase
MKNILVTGATGFIGSNLVKSLVGSGDKRIIPSARNRNDRFEGVFNLPLNEWDVLNESGPEVEGTVDVIIHCATSNDIVSADFFAGMDLTLRGTRNVLEYALRNNVNEVFFLSTIQVYGTDLVGEVTVGRSLRCETPYALNHFYGEELCRMYQQKYGLKVTIIRPTNVYGVPSCSTVNRNTLVPACFVMQALESGCIRMRSSGIQCRNFISNDELSNGIIGLIDSSTFDDHFRVVNIASNLFYSIREVADLVSDIYFELNHKELPIYIDAQNMQPKNLFQIREESTIKRPKLENSQVSLRKTIINLFQGSY